MCNKLQTDTRYIFKDIVFVHMYTQTGRWAGTYTHIRKDYFNVDLLVNNALMVKHCFGNPRYATQVKHIFKSFINKMD